MGEGGRDEELASAKKIRIEDSECKNGQNGGKLAKIDTLFMTEAAEKPCPLGPHIPI